jgi:hypothetical protein
MLLSSTVSQIAGARSNDERLENLRKLVNEAKAEIDEIESAPRVFIVELEHPRLGITRVGVDPDTLDGTIGSLLDVSLALLTKAATTAASRTIENSSFDSHEEHKAAIEKRASTFHIIGIKHSADALRWHVSGRTRDGHLFEVYVQAIDQDEAEFQARWQVSSKGAKAALRLEDLPAFLGGLYTVTIDSAEPKPVDIQELASGILNLVTLIEGLANQQTAREILDSQQFAHLEAMLAKINAPLSAPTAEADQPNTANALADTPAGSIETADVAAALPEAAEQIQDNGSRFSESESQSQGDEVSTDDHDEEESGEDETQVLCIDLPDDSFRDGQ